MKRIKKKLLTLALALAMCLGMCQGYALTAQAAGAAVVVVAPGMYGFSNDSEFRKFSDGLMPVKDPNTNKWGYINTAGQLAIPCLYGSAGKFQEGAAKVKMDNSTYAFIGTAGQVLFSWSSRQDVQPVDNAVFSEGMIQAKSKGKYGFLNMAGQLVVPCQYEKVSNFYGGMAAVRDANSKKWGFVNMAGQLAVACQYDQVRGFNDGLAAVHDQATNYWGYVDAGGNAALPFQYKEAYSFVDGYARVEMPDGKGTSIMIDKTGRNVIPEGYSYVERDWNYFSKNEGVVLIYENGDENNGVRLLNEAGQIIKPDYDAIDNYDLADRINIGSWDFNWENSFSDGLVRISNRYGEAALFDLAGRAVLKKYWGIQRVFDRGDGYYSTADGLVDRDGNVMVRWPEGVNGSGGKFNEGFLRVFSNATGTKRYGFMNVAGQVVVPCTYAEAGSFSGGVAPVKNDVNRWGLVDATGAEVLPFQYTEVKLAEGAIDVYFVKEGDKYGLVAAPTSHAANGAIVNYAAKAEVDSAVNAGLVVNEALGGDYRAEITREQLAATAVKLYEAASGQPAPAVGATPFTDVDNVAVTQAKTLELIDGLPDGQFVPKATVPREQAAAILSGVSAKLNGTVSAEQAAKFESEGSTRKTASIEETLATAARILKKIKK